MKLKKLNLKKSFPELKILFGLIFLLLVTSCTATHRFGTEVGNPSETTGSKCASLTVTDSVNQLVEKILDPICLKLIECGYVTGFRNCYEKVLGGRSDDFFSPLGVETEQYENWEELWEALGLEELTPNLEHSYTCYDSIRESTCLDLENVLPPVEQPIEANHIIPENWLAPVCQEIFGDPVEDDMDWIQPSDRQDTSDPNGSPPENKGPNGCF